MKKIIALFLTFVLAVSFPACTGNGDKNSPDTSSDSSLDLSSDSSSFNSQTIIKSSPSSPSRVQQDTARAAVVDDFSGTVSATLDTGDMPAFKGLALIRRNSIGTGTESWSTLELSEGQFALIEENSTVQIAQLADDAKSAELYMKDGRIWIGIKKMLSDDESFVVNTPSCSFSVRGTVFSVEYYDNEPTLYVYKGKVEMRAQDENGNPVLDANGNEVIFDVSENCKAGFTVENGVVTEEFTAELTEEDWLPLCSDGPEGAGGAYIKLRECLPELVWHRIYKDDYFPNETINVYISGVTAEMKAANALVAVYKRGSEDDGGMSGRVSNIFFVPEGNSVQQIPAPNAFGEYEIHFYSANKDFENTLQWIIQLVVGDFTHDGSIELNKEEFFPNEVIDISVAGITAREKAANALVAVYKRGSEDDGGISGRVSNIFFVPEGNSVQQIPAPNNFGEYEVHLYSMNRNHEETFVTLCEFTVGDATHDGSIELNKDEFFPNEVIDISVAGITAREAKTNALVAVYKRGSEDDGGISGRVSNIYFVPEGASVQQIPAPNNFGEYEVHLYSMNRNHEETLVMIREFTVR